MSRRAWPIELGSGCRRLHCTCERGHGPKFREQRVDATAGNVGCDSWPRGRSCQTGRLVSTARAATRDPRTVFLTIARSAPMN